MASVASLGVIPVSRELRDPVCVQGGAVGVALESVKRGSLGAHIEGEAANLNRFGQEDVDRVRQANAPACVDSCGIGLDLGPDSGHNCGQERKGWHVDTDYGARRGEEQLFASDSRGEQDGEACHDPQEQQAVGSHSTGAAV